MASTDTVIRREYVYSDVYGIHVINVRAFNLANNDTTSASVDVLEWPCETPNISIDPLFIDQTKPFVALTEDGFTVTANFTVSCMKNERFNARWEILDSAQQNVLTTIANASQLVSASNALPAGDYVIRINMTMWSSYFDLSDKTVISYAYVNIQRCQSPNITVNPLFSSANDPYRTLAENGFTVTIDYSFDCEKLELFNISWDILDSSQLQTFSTIPNATQLTSLANALLPGSYVIRINVTMFSSFFDLSHKAVVAYAYVNVYHCQPPNVTLHPLAESSQPFSTPDVVGFTVTADLLVDCPPVEQLTAKWDILHTSQLTVRTEPNATEIASLPYDLPVGVYTIRVITTISSSFLNLSEKTVVAFTYVNVTLTALVAGIEGRSYINATFNSTVYLSAYNRTFSSNQLPTDKSGMVFEWRCKRSSEAWPSQLPTQLYLPHNGTSGGCFGDVGPGVLGFAAGLWSFTVDTGYLEPLIEYNIQFLVWKDLNSATANVSLYVQQPLAPNITIRSVQNYKLMYHQAALDFNLLSYISIMYGGLG